MPLSSTPFSGLHFVEFLVLPFGPVISPTFSASFPVPVHSLLARRVGSLDFDVIHCRAAHLSPAVLLPPASSGVSLLRTSTLSRLTATASLHVTPAVNKSERALFPVSRHRYTHPMHLVHVDILDMTVYGRGNVQYLLVLVDAFSCAIFSHPLARAKPPTRSSTGFTSPLHSPIDVSGPFSRATAVSSRTGCSSTTSPASALDRASPSRTPRR